MLPRETPRGRKKKRERDRDRDREREKKEKGWNLLESSFLKITEMKEVISFSLALFIIFVSDINVLYLKTRSVETVGTHGGQKRTLDLRTEATGNCELPDVSAGNQTRVLWKSMQIQGEGDARRGEKEELQKRG
ncbi:hypothetical protein LEMLEM_LOCUS25181 [Lemmus lemmus]